MPESVAVYMILCLTTRGFSRIWNGVGTSLSQRHDFIAAEPVAAYTQVQP